MKIISLAFIFLVAVSIQVRSQAITAPRTASPAAIVGQTIGVSTITVRYSRPSVKGRKVWGELVQWGWTADVGNGPAPWRAGANENTVLELSHDATIEGTRVPKGSYGFFLTINEDNTGEVILSKDFHSWGHFRYNPANDLMRAPIKVRDHEMTEMLTYEFINASKNQVELVLNWEKKQFPVKIEFDVDGIVMANAAEELMGVKGFTWQGYSSAANYAAANKINLDQGGKWADQAVNINRTFQTLSVKAAILRQTNHADEADKLMKEAVALGNENELNAYGYNLIALGQTDRAIEVFVLNTTKYPNSANTFDSLGEAYMTKGDKANAIKSFKKSLALNPPAATKANSEKYLKQLGAM